MRLNISNINLIPPDPCRATLAFVDVNGNPVMRPDGTQVVKQVLLGAGQSAFLQFHAGPFLGRDEVRVHFRPVVLVPPDPLVPTDPNRDPTLPPDPLLPPDPCVPSLEIIDGATGQTRVLSAGLPRLAR